MTGGQKGDLKRGEKPAGGYPYQNTRHRDQSSTLWVEGQHVIPAWEQEQRL
jgi:hypothetical protein